MVSLTRRPYSYGGSKMSDIENDRPFILGRGAFIKVPSNLREYVYSNSRNAERDGQIMGTPMMMRVVHDKNGYTFLKQKGAQHGFILFVPELKGGELLEVAWVDRNCACAVEHKPTFTLSSGAVIRVPFNLQEYVYTSSRKAGQDGLLSVRTPMVMRIVKRKNGICTFQKKGLKGGVVLFVPELKGGEHLKVDWVDLNCACAV